MEVCEQSFKNALKLFEQYFTQTKVADFACCHWIFYPLYEKVMPESNLAALMCERYLVPWSSGSTDGLFFLFGRDYDKPSTYSCDTLVRRDIYRCAGQMGRQRKSVCVYTGMAAVLLPADVVLYAQIIQELEGIRRG